MTQPKSHGGLGIVPVKHTNQALLAKWWFKWLMDIKAFWHKLVKAKYDCHSCKSLGDVLVGRNISPVLKGIADININNSFGTSLHFNQFQWSIKDGRTAMFWEDCWSGTNLLSSKFPRLFNLSRFKFTSVRDFCELWNDPKTEIETLWSHQLRVWELEEAIKINDIIENLVFSLDSDQFIWLPSKKPFAMADGKKVLASLDFAIQVNRQGNYNSIWRLKIPPKIHIFLWKIEHGVLPSRVFLSSHLRSSMIDTSCKICGDGVEDQMHIIWLCPSVRGIWEKVFEWWGIHARFSTSMHLDFVSWLHWFSDHAVKIGWGVLLASVLWSIWLNRNRVLFENKAYSSKEVMFLIKIRSFHWFQAVNLVSKDSSVIWRINPIGIIKAHSSTTQRDLMSFSTEVFGFVDGSFRISDSDSTSAGIRGYIKDINNKILFNFSGPVYAITSFLAELYALKHLLQEMSTSVLANKECIIYMDCEELVNLVLKIKVGNESANGLIEDNVKSIIKQ